MHWSRPINFKFLGFIKALIASASRQKYSVILLRHFYIPNQQRLKQMHLIHLMFARQFPCYSLLHRYQTKRGQIGPARWKSAAISRSDIRIDSLPRLYRIVYAFLHPQRREWEEEQTVHSNRTLDHSFHYSPGNSSLMTIAKRYKWYHCSRKGIHPRRIVSVVVFRYC